jgi:mannose-6-phosphate isomerase-like protein (cupin superfamily)
VHEHRDHVLQILDGTTVYEVGGTLKNARNTRPGEWRAPAADGTTSLTLKKGDMLTIPRGTPHKRSTAESVTLLLISCRGNRYRIVSSVTTFRLRNGVCSQPSQ